MSHHNIKLYIETVKNKTQVLLCDLNVEKCQGIIDDFAKRFRNVSAHAVKCDVTVEDEFESKLFEKTFRNY